MKLQIPILSRIRDGQATGTNLNSGFSLAEVVVVLGMLAIMISVLVQLNLTFLQRVGATSLTIRADALAVETMEALRALRDEDWSNLSGLVPETDYYLSFSEDQKKWTAASGNPGEIENIFSRSFRVYPVYRDPGTGSIVAAGGSLDGDILRIEAVVGWNDRGVSQTRRLVSYLSNF